MATLRDRLKAEFKRVDTAKTGLVTESELKILLKQVNPGFKADEIELILSKLKVNEGKIQFDEFLDVFIGDVKVRQALTPALARKTPPEELEIIQAAFSEFDKDGSKQIDLRELQAMCKKLGKQLPDDQAAAAMQQLDKNGDMQCNFDEFLLWWTCTPGLGGYNSVALQFLKAKLAMEAGIRKLRKRASKTVEGSDDFAFKGALDVTPDISAASKSRCSITVGMRKAQTSPGAGASPRLTVQMTAKDIKAAESVCSAFNGLKQLFLGTGGNAEFIDIIQDYAKVIITFVQTENDGDEDALVQAFCFLESTVKKIEGKITCGVSLDDILENPDRPMLMHFKGARAEGDVIVGITALANFLSKTGMPPETEAAAKVINAVVQDLRFAYNEPNILLLAAKAREIMKGTRSLPDAFGNDPLGILTGSLRDMRAKLYSAMEAEGDMFQEEKWTGGLVKEHSSLINLVRAMGAGITSLDTIVLDRLPGTAAELVVTFDQVNPCPLLNYLVGSYPKNPDKQDSRWIPPGELQKLSSTFQKYDKDGSGSIDLKELDGMLKDLGGNISKEELDKAMQGLDTNKDGKCNFEEFKQFWSSNDKLGGYSSVGLTFLKAKLRAGAMLDKGRKLISTAGSFVGVGESTEDTLINLCSDVGPVGKSIQEKMSMALAIQQVDVKAKGKPFLCVKLCAKSEEAAKQIRKNVADLMVPMKEIIEESGVEVKVGGDPDGVEVRISIYPPAEFMQETIYADAALMKAITPLVKAIKNSSARLVWANEFDDFLAKPDTPMPVVFAGYQGIIDLSVAAAGKRLFLDALPHSASEGASPEGLLPVLIEFLRLFAGARLQSVVCFHEENRNKCVSMNEEYAKMVTPSSLRELIATLIPMDGLPVDELLPVVDGGSNILQNLDSIESVSVENIDLPVEFAANGLPATLGIKFTCTNFKVFDLINYILDPSLARFKAMNQADKCHGTVLAGLMMN